MRQLINNNPFYWSTGGRIRTRFIRSMHSWALSIKNAASPQNALKLYSEMHRQSIPSDSFSILFTIKSCAALHRVGLIRLLHSHIFKLGYATHVYVATSLLHAYVLVSLNDACQLFDEMPRRNTVTWNTIITGHAKFGDINTARQVFDEMPVRNIDSWSAMIAGYSRIGNYRSGLACFRDMLLLDKQLKLDCIALGSVLSCIAQMGGSLGFSMGRSVHGFAKKNGWEMNVETATILVDMYAKCGSLKYAGRLFDLMPERNVITWTALICGSAQHGYSKQALSLFELMQQMGVRPNEFTFTGVLNACAHTGDVEQGRKFLKMMTEQYGLKPGIQHYGCLVDLLGKAGLVDEAYEVIRTMNDLEPNVFIWGSFLAACKEHKRFEMAARVIERVWKTVKPESDGGIYTLISDLYVLNGKWDEAERIRKSMANQGVRKLKGTSLVDY